MNNPLPPTRKTLSFQAKSVAYLEKHRIYELFHELATELVIKQPDDPQLFIKLHLDRISKKRDVPRVILLAPPTFDIMGLANVLKQELKVLLLTLEDLRSGGSFINSVCRCYESEDLASKMRTLVESRNLGKMPGWILAGIPRTKKEAQVFQRLGIIPTHVLLIRLPNEEGGNSWSCDYLNNLRGLREAYANFLIEIDVGTRSMKELAKDCVKLTKKRENYGAPSLFRIALIGLRGSGCTTQAKLIAERFNLVHIDYEYIESQARLQQTALGEMLRSFEKNAKMKPKPEIKIQIIEKYVSRYECLRRGWILTGYPKTVEEFKLLDLIPTPPNRIIFVNTRIDVCRERLINRRYNMATGCKLNIPANSWSGYDNSIFGIHPKDFVSVVDSDLKVSEENMRLMMDYAGDTVFKIDGNAAERTVRERIESCLMCAAPCAKPRIPRTPEEVSLSEIEFEPDD